MADPFIGVIGSTQVTVLKEFAKGGRKANGFMDRLLFVYPEIQKTLKWNINKVDEIHLKNYYTIITNLLELGRDNEESPILIPIESEAEKYLFNWQNSRPDKYFFEYERTIDIKLQQYVIRFALILQLIHHITDGISKEKIELFAIKEGIRLFNYFYINALRVRYEVTAEDYFESLGVLQKSILNDLPETDQFTTKQGIEIACKIVDGKPRISERQFKTYLNDKKLFIKIKRGLYKRRL